MYCLDRTDLTQCHARLRGGSRTFYAASFLLPRRIREPAAALYAFCRVADDAIDQGSDCERALEHLRYRLDRIYAGNPIDASEDRALACVAHHFGIPKALPEALLEGFEWDIEERVYEELDELHGYSARVAGTVGAMMSCIMGAREPATIARACELGMAMQLTNIARDVGEDARAGRLYLPRRWMLEAGIDPDAWLSAPAYSDALGSVIGRLLTVADELYANAEPGIADLPLGCRLGIRSARTVYSEIGREVERGNMDSVSRRAVVPGSRKLSLIMRAATAPAVAGIPAREQVIEPARFLVDAVRTAPAAVYDAPLSLPAAWWQLNRRLAWTVELFDQLERREQLGR